MSKGIKITVPIIPGINSEEYDLFGHRNTDGSYTVKNSNDEIVGIVQRVKGGWLTEGSPWKLPSKTLRDQIKYMLV